MIEMVVITGTLIAMVCISAYFAFRPCLMKEKRRMGSCDNEELVALLIEKSKGMRTYRNGGGGASCTEFYNDMLRVNRMISRKVNKKVPLTEAEIWYYENFHLVYRFIFSRVRDMRNLPHCDNEPRIVKIARIIVDNSLGCLNSNRIKFVMENIKDAFSFTYREIRNFNDAIGAAIIEQLFILSQRLKYAEKCKKYAKKSIMDEKLLSKDVYLYHMLQRNDLPQKINFRLEKAGIDKKRVINNYNYVMMRNTAMAETLFSALRNEEGFFSAMSGIEYLGAYKVLIENYSLKNVSIDTLYEYFDRINKIADKRNASEVYVAKKLSEIAEYNGKDISEILFDYPRSLSLYVADNRLRKLGIKKKIGEKTYVLGVTTVAFCAAVGVGIALKNIAFGILSFIPLFFSAENLINYLLSHLSIGFFAPSMAYEKVPYDHSAMIVISEYISGIEQLKKSIFHAKTLLYGNFDANIRVGLLIDTPADSVPITDLDREIIEYLTNENLPNNLCVYVRKKSYLKKKFVARERKRGAIMALAKYLLTKEQFEFLFISEKEPITPRYVITLDADNTVLPGEAMRLVNMMAHPYNEKYDLLTMQGRTNLFSFKNLYALRYTDETGFEEYPTYSGLYYKLFKTDVYCGKGIIRTERLYNKLAEIFPSEKILSHDVIEGSILKTGSGGMCFEDAPENFISDRERRKRWMRGDVQLLPFLFGLWKNDGKNRYKSDFSPVSRFIMAKNILSTIKEACILSLLVIGLCVSPILFGVAFGIFALPYVINQVKIIRSCVSGDKISSILRKSAKNFFFAFEEFFLIGYYAVDNLIVLVTTLTRMAFGKNLLQWKTYYSSQKTRDFSSYVRLIALPTLAMTVITAVLMSVGINVLPCAIYIYSTFLTFDLLYCSSQIRLKNKTLQEKDREKLKELAASTYKYFCFMRNNNGLIADNFQLKPYKGQSKTTSPTNLAFSILSEICAYLIKIITYDECIINLKKIISALSSLKKWHGNLYNWYKISDGEPTNCFVSSVDNGNLAAALMLAKLFFKQKGDNSLASEFELILSGMRLDKLYDERKKLFYIGFDGKKYCGHYDLLASEARILSLIYVALYHDYAHISSLKKDYVGLGGNVLLSWSGTMFEMLMPEIFFAPPYCSSLYRSEKYTVKKHREEKTENVWGISESGYYAFDENMNYQYSAFGLKSLALNSNQTGTVVAPYAAILGLKFDPKSVVENIEELKKAGCGFEYGMFEAIDFGEGKHIIYSAMTHHQGMILASITNFLMDDVLQKIMKTSPKIASCLEYFNEKRPDRRFPQKTRKNTKKYTSSNINYCKISDKIQQYFQTAALSDTQYSIICNSLGGGFSKFGNILINKNSGVYEENNGIFFFASTNGKEWCSPTYLPFADDRATYEFGYTEKEIFYRSSRGLEEKVGLMPMLNCEVRKFSADEKYKNAALYFDVCIDEKNSFDAHPAFRNLFVSVTKISSDQIIIEKRMPGENGETAYFGVKVFGVDKIEWECNKVNFIGRCNKLSNAQFLFGTDCDKSYPSQGDVLNPCVGFRAEFNTAKNECTVCIMYGLDKNFVTQTLSSFTEDVFNCAIQATGRRFLSEKFNELSGEVLYAPYEKTMLKNIVDTGKNVKFNNFRNNRKTIQYNLDVNRVEKVNEFVAIIKDFRAIGFEVNSTIYSNNELTDNIKKYVIKFFEENKINDYIFISGICDEKYWAFIELDADFNFKKRQFSFSKVFTAEKYAETFISERILPNKVFECGNGFFDERGDYIVTKPTRAPYTNVIGDERGGIVATCDGGGFYYFGNSREDKCVRFDNDPIEKSAGERFFIKTATGYIDVFGINSASYSTIGKGVITCNFNSDKFNSTVSSFTACYGDVKVSEVRIKKKKPCYLEFLYAFYPTASWRYDPADTVFTQNGDTITVINILNGKEFFVKIIGIEKSNLALISDKETVPFFEYYCEKNEERIYIVSSKDVALIHSLNEENIRFYSQRSREYFSSLSDIDFSTKEKSFDYLVNFLPYQIISSRLNAKSGFYQVGGATGFRDQLQDSLAMFTRPEIMKGRIISACLHQYEEGDVMHWWHDPKYGLRTRITDDKLFLPYVVCKYIEYVGDEKILDEQYPYLSSNSLAPKERDRFENPRQTEYNERVFSHCLRAIRSALKYGQHNLLVMGSGDWNDGLDFVCEKGLGESVFNSMFAYMVLTEFSAFCPPDLQSEMLSTARELKDAINTHAFETDRYKRLFSDDGRWLGSSRSEALQLDLLTQAFAVISGVADEKRAEICMETAKTLVDEKAGLIRLLSPPLTQKDYLGYICDYPKGVRENGGQYTHAAMWYLIALTKIGKQDEAYELFQMINPVEKCTNSDKNDVYSCEPYVLCGDIYSNKDNYGRGGWSWYTGSAAWAYKLVTEHFFGIKRRGNRLYIEPCLPKKLIGSVIVYRHKNSSYVIEYRMGLLPKIIVDGEIRDCIELGENARKSVVVETGC